MKKVILIFIMLFFPIVVSAGDTVKIKCKSSEIKMGDAITCEIKTSTSKAINAISADLKLSNNLQLVEITKNKIFEGDANGGDIDLYLGYDLIIPVEIVEIKIKLLNDNTDAAYVNVQNIVYTDKTFQDVPGENASLMLKVIKQKLTTTTVATTTAPVTTTMPKTTTRITETTRVATRTTEPKKNTTKKISIPELPDIKFTTESKKEETTATTTTRKTTTRTEVVRTTKTEEKKFLDINISDDFLIYLILLLLCIITYLVIKSYVKKQKQ